MMAVLFSKYTQMKIINYNSHERNRQEDEAGNK